MFEWYTNESLPGALQFEIDLYKRLWNFFLIGASYYFIINHHNVAIELVSEEVQDTMGYTPSQFTLPLMNEILHPEDHPWFLSFGNCVMEFFSKLPVE